ncbi:MAG: carboxypeptidase regulatory-like domain-containing protein [Myxococcales bacterium]
MHRYFAKLILLAFVTLVVPGALAQGVTGSAVSGTVKKTNGEPVANAAVQLRNPATGDTFSATTLANGRFTVDNVPPGGPYVLTATAEGFEPTVIPDLQLTLGQRLPLDPIMRTQLIEEIAVVAHRDNFADHQRTGPSTVMKTTTITELPLQGRNFTDLLSTDPRISQSSVGGQNNRYNNIQIDGGANNDLFGLAGNGTPGGQSNAKPLSVEAIQEFTIQVAPFDVRQGMFAGGLVNAITKSGTNEFHGSIFGYEQNKSLANGKAYINGVNTDDPNFLSYNTFQYGLTLGGPIIKDKAHFFIAADLQSKYSPFGNQFQMTGTDSHDLGVVGFSNVQAQHFIDTLRTKYGVSAPGNVLSPNLNNPDHNVFAKVTSSAIENSHLEVSFNWVDASQDVLTRAPLTAENFNSGGLRDGYQLSTAGYGIGNDTYTGRAKLTSNWNEGKVSNELHGGVSMIRDKRNIANDIPLILVKIGDPAVKNDPLMGPGVGSSPAWIAAGGERFSQANILDQNIFQLQDNVTMTAGEHRFTLGSSNEFFHFRNVFLQAATGAWAFNSLSDFDNGIPAAFQRRFGVSPNQEPGTATFAVSQWGFYGQDEWTATENVSFTMGLRMDLPILSRPNRNLAVFNSPLAIDTGHTPTGNPLWSPRFGFNWDVQGNSDTIVRGGIGIFSGRPPYVWVSNAYTVNGLSQVELDCTAATGLPAFTVDPAKQPSDCKGGTGTPVAPTNVGEIDYFDPNTKYPQNMRVALGADKRLPWGLVGTADFLYTEDVNGWYTNDENLKFLGLDGEGRATYGTFRNGTTSTGAPTLVATPSRIDTRTVTQAIEVYNKNGGKVTSITAQLQKSFGRRYGVSVAYTYSRSLDRISLTSSQALSNWRFAPIDGDLDNRNVRPSAFDRPHKITISGTAAWQLGSFGSLGAGVSYVGQSGTPYTWLVTGDVNGDGVNGNDVPFIPASATQISLQDPTQYAALAQFINSQSCLADAKGTFIRRGACRNPWQDFMDVRISWTSPEWKGQRLEAQWDIFNVLNLINPAWGHFDQVAPFETAPSNFLTAVGYDAVNKRPVYSFRPPPSIINPVYSPTLSRWRMQLGAKYMF